MKKIVRNQEGFTLIEIIAVLILLGILAAVAIPKYMDLTTTAREKAAVGQIAEVKGRLNSALAKFMLENSGIKPATGVRLVQYTNSQSTNACNLSDATAEGDFNFKCLGDADNVTITVSQVQGNAVTGVTGTFKFKD